MKNKNILNQIDDGMMEFFINADISAIESMFNEEEANFSNTSSKRKKLAKKIQFLAKAKLNKEKEGNLMQKAQEKLKDLIQKGSEQQIVLLKKMLQQKGVKFQFRSLKKLSEKDVEDIFKDINLVRLMEEIEQEGNLDNQ